MVLAQNTVFESDGGGLFTFEATGATLAQFLNNYYAGLRIKDLTLPDGAKLKSISIEAFDANNDLVASDEKDTFAHISLATIGDYQSITRIVFGVQCETIRIREDWDAVAEKVNQSVQVIISPMFFTIESLGLWITPQQQMQFVNIYPFCFDDAYRTAVGKLTAQVGNIFNMQAILDETDEERKDNTIRWVLQVLTASFVCSATLNMSEPLERAEKEVTGIIAQLKGGQVSLQEPAAHREDEYNAEAEVVTTRNKYIG